MGGVCTKFKIGKIRLDACQSDQTAFKGDIIRKQAYLLIVEALESPDNSIHIPFDTVQMIECSRNLTNYIVQSRT